MGEMGVWGAMPNFARTPWGVALFRHHAAIRRQLRLREEK